MKLLLAIKMFFNFTAEEIKFKVNRPDIDEINKDRGFLYIKSFFFMFLFKCLQ